MSEEQNWKWNLNMYREDLSFEKYLLVHNFRRKSVHKEASSSKQNFLEISSAKWHDLTARTEKLVKSKKIFLMNRVRQKKTLWNRARQQKTQVLKNDSSTCTFEISFVSTKHLLWVLIFSMCQLSSHLFTSGGFIQLSRWEIELKVHKFEWKTQVNCFCG